ncbi:MAG: ABC transporter substrate-binding protein [Flavobacteriaceae bacterium]|nr:ABC transporter substrate-binding protein [Flavobacteriaceae bacterium]
MTTVNIGGVPEHFNLSWYLTLKDGSYKDRGINLRWQDFHGGTGQMCRALRNEEIDLAVVLTEGIIKDIIDGNQSKIVQVFVASPLIWGIHVAAQSEFQKIEQLKGTKAAISRFGSGSHLMAYVNAQRNNWDLDKDLKFELIKNLDGAVEGLTKGIADYFLWEKFTTKPLVDDGVFRRIGECPTPWPCFVIAASNKFIKEQNNHLQTILEIINTTSMEFKQIPSIDRMIANRYGQDIDDVKEWLSLTEWSSEQIDGATLDRVQKQLFDLGIIDRIAANDELIV